MSKASTSSLSMSRRRACAVHADACFVAPSPELRARLQTELAQLRGRTAAPLSGLLGLARKPRALGLDDGVIIPPEEFPAGTSAAVIRAAAAERPRCAGVCA